MHVVKDGVFEKILLRFALTSLVFVASYARLPPGSRFHLKHQHLHVPWQRAIQGFCGYNQALGDVATASGPPLHPHRLLVWGNEVACARGRGVVFALALLTNNSVFLFRAKILRKPAIGRSNHVPPKNQLRAHFHWGENIAFSARVPFSVSRGSLWLFKLFFGPRSMVASLCWFFFVFFAACLLN